MSHLIFLVAFLATNLQEIPAQSTGDVRLIGQSNANLGRLEIYWKGQWSTFCGAQKNSFTMGAAQAACRQLGYLDAFRFDTVSKLNFSKATSDTPIAFGGADCEYNFALGALHILRCSTSETVPSSCTHDDDIGLVCEPSSLWQHPYSTQVRLSSRATPSYTSAGVLEIYIIEKWGTVCFSDSGFDRGAADSVCRQMGYTNAETYRGMSTASTETVWLKKLTCGRKSHDCINCCPGYGIPNSPTSCGSDVCVYIQCTFDVSLRGSSGYSAGSESVCSMECHDSSSFPVAIAVVTTVLLLSVITGALLILLCICCLVPSCRLYKWRKEKFAGYTSNL